ncbi:MAG: TonB-dependent receptor [Gammaproteobacteria bacterium]|nr:TonB-dependent receptor [Gammaproteobacteria bacterium]
MLLFAATSTAFADPESAVKQLSGLSLAQLSHVEVTSVLKRAQTLGTAPASVYVITRDEIVRAGAHTIPEALRLAPNLQVSASSSTSYAISARGFIGNPATQAFANQILILIDGRSVYSPLFSGVFYDQLDVMLDDVDRIEVISGPGGTLWGANAVNGVINIITRSAQDSRGALLSAAGGAGGGVLGMRYGAPLGGAGAYRVYANGFQKGALELADGSSAHDGWRHGQAGFRNDWSADRDAFTVQGDVYRATENQAGTAETALSGANVLARWRHAGERSSWDLQGYFDHSETGQPAGGAGFVLNSYDLQLQNLLRASDALQIVWGVGERLNSYHIANSATLLFEPSHRALTLTEVFAQGTLALATNVEFILGLKLEDDPYSAWISMPNIRLGWNISERELLWASAARAVRSPTPLDVDVMEKLGSELFLRGNPNFQDVKVDTYELGYRGTLSRWLTLSATAYYSVYDNLRSVEPAPIVFLPVEWGNMIEGPTYGTEAWATFQLTPWWHLSPSIRTFHERLRFKPGASGLLTATQNGDDPGSAESLKSSMNLGARATLDAMLRHVATLPSPYVPAYTELRVRLGWQASHAWELGVVGNNLLHSRHEEFPTGEFVARSVALEVRWKPDIEL